MLWLCKAKCNQSSVNFTYFLMLSLQKVLQPVDRGVKWTVAFYTGALKMHSGPKNFGIA